MLSLVFRSLHQSHLKYVEAFMEYQIALARGLGLSPVDFVAAWNEDPASRALAEARLATAGTTRAYDPFLEGTLAVLVTLGSGIATNALYDLLKQFFVKRGEHRHITIITVKKHDGSEVQVVDIDQKQ